MVENQKNIDVIRRVDPKIVIPGGNYMIVSIHFLYENNGGSKISVKFIFFHKFHKNLKFQNFTDPCLF